MFTIGHATPGGIRGRYAPSPTGMIHLGNARTALVAWLSVRSRNGTFVWRIEDIDTPRVVPGMAEAQMEDLAWLGIDWDEGPDPVGGVCAPYRQQERTALYERALAYLHDQGRLFPCRLSRKDLAGMASAPHGTGTEGPPYPKTLRPRAIDPGWFDSLLNSQVPDASIRFQVDDSPVTFEDRIAGRHTERVDQTAGDFVLKRRDGLYAYQLAVVVDDLLQGISEVVRGVDLLSSAGRQIQLIHALGGRVPEYAHVPLVVNEQGEKLNKRDRARTLRALRLRGISAEQVVGVLAYSLGLSDRPEPCRAMDLITSFDWLNIPRQPVTIPDFG